MNTPKKQTIYNLLSDKYNLNKALMDLCNDLKAKIESMKETAEQLAIFQKELVLLKQEH